MLGPLGKALLFAEWKLVKVTPELLGALLAHPSPLNWPRIEDQGDGHALTADS